MKIPRMLRPPLAVFLLLVVVIWPFASLREALQVAFMITMFAGIWFLPAQIAFGRGLTHRWLVLFANAFGSPLIGGVALVVALQINKEAKETD